MTPEAYQIRDAVLALFDGSDLFKFRSAVPVDFEPDDQLPGLVVAPVEERLAAEGDLTVAEPRFAVSLTLAAVVRVQANNRNDAAARLERRSKAVLAAILKSATFVASVDGFSDITIVPRYWKDGERFFGEDEARITIIYRTQFPPIVTDELDRVRITTQLLGSTLATPALMTEVELTTP